MAFTSATAGGMLSGVRRIRWIDVLAAAAAVAGGILLMVGNLGWDDVDASPLIVPAIVPFCLTVLWRNVRPMHAAAAALGLLGLHVLLFGGIVRCGIVYPVTWLLAYAVGARLDRRDSRLALAFVLATQLVMTLDDVAVGLTVNLLLWPVTVGVWSAGRVVQTRDELVVELRERTTELRHARDERARLEVATDRARLSSELDRLLQRRLADLAALAAAGRATRDPQAATALLVDIERAGRRTLEEMRSVVGVLRHDEDAPTAPQPTLTRLDDLIARARGDGTRVQVEGNPRVLPAGVELSAYRVVEHLLAALDGAGEVEVGVRFGDRVLELWVAGPAARRPEPAIERARERVELHRGTLEASMRGGRAEAMAQLPVLAGG